MELTSTLPSQGSALEPLAFRQKHEEIHIVVGSSELILPPVPAGLTLATKDLGRAFLLAGTYEDPSQIWLIATTNNIVLDIKFAPILGMPPLEIKNNELSGLPENWDCNHSAKGIEIVNENATPVFQMFYKDDTHLVMRGAITSTNGGRGTLITISDVGIALSSANNLNSESLSQKVEDLNLKKIFKYPAWQHPGEFAN